jgi:hypothetical protein
MENLSRSLVKSSVQFFNDWANEFLKQNYLDIIIAFITLFILWFIIVLIKSWIFKINDIASSLKRIADNLESFNQKSKEIK